MKMPEVYKQRNNKLLNAYECACKALEVHAQCSNGCWMPSQMPG